MIIVWDIFITLIDLFYVLLFTKTLLLAINPLNAINESELITQIRDNAFVLPFSVLSLWVIL